MDLQEPNYWVEQITEDGPWVVWSIGDRDAVGSVETEVEAEQLCADLNTCASRPWARMLLRNHSTV
jgi:hypothetical protein